MVADVLEDSESLEWAITSEPISAHKDLKFLYYSPVINAYLLSR